jgi:hypothetical protein
MKTSKYLGVRFERGRWRAEIRIHGSKKFLGYFHDEKIAAEAYDVCIEKYNLSRPKNDVNVSKDKKTLNQVVLEAITAKGATPFSSHDITNLVREKVNGNSILLTDVPRTFLLEVGNFTHEIVHKDVKKIVEQICVPETYKVEHGAFTVYTLLSSNKGLKLFQQVLGKLKS